MPQELHVLQCFNCSTFQVHIVKKVPKWYCKLCNEKQSIKKVFGRGTGKECRLFVQELNEKRLNRRDTVSNYENFGDNTNFHEPENSSNDKDDAQDVTSKWLEFTEETQTHQQNSPEVAVKFLEKPTTTTVIDNNIFESDPKDLDSILDFKF